ncbi:peptidoglycan/LPS O-acetylase OafA/YrhL [Actinopolyspora lacussalsi]|nr:peptidoglycan/LPS O-acetylase OafA/YrhL [Actinopolyspora lacussalsi]
MTGMRFLAALAVFGFHSSLQIPANSVFAHDGVADTYQKIMSQAGAAGVTFFFVLSGFVMTWSYKPHDRNVDFWRRRLVKIYPNHVVTWAVALLLFAAVYTHPYQAVANLFLVQAWIPEYDTYLSVNPPSWSLSTEVAFYLLFPLVFAVARKIREQYLWWFVWLTVALVAITALVAYVLLPEHPRPPDGLPISTYQYWVNYVFPPLRLFDFFLGILLARIVLAGRWVRLGIGPLVLALLGCYTVSLFVPYLYGMRAVCIVPLALLIPAIATSDVRGERSFLRGRTMVWLGEISFAFYLVHAIVLVTGRELLGDSYFGTPLATGVLLLYLVLSILLAWALYEFVEKPTTKHWSKPKKKGSGKRNSAATENLGAGGSRNDRAVDSAVGENESRSSATADR